MHYTSWDRSDRANPVLLAEDGPEQLGVFSEHSAEVDGHFWRTEVSDLGASATLADGSIYRLAGRPGRDKCLEAVSYTHLTLPTTLHECRSRWSPYH